MFFSTPAFTIFHVALSLIGIASGGIVILGLLKARWLDGWTAIFLASTAATTVTGFLFPVHQFLPSHGVGIVSAIVLGTAIFARYSRHLLGAWRLVYVITASIALYLNVFVLIAQLFLKVPALRAIAPTQADAPFLIAQTLALVLFVAVTVAAAIRFRGAPISSALPAQRIVATHE